MELFSKTLSDTLLFYVKGEIINSCAGEITKAVSPTVNSSATVVAIDIREVPYIDSSGLATLIDLHQRLRDAGKRLDICNPGEFVRQLFWDSGLEEIFNIIERSDLPKTV